jgi:hypothetical protein
MSNYSVALNDLRQQSPPRKADRAAIKDAGGNKNKQAFPLAWSISPPYSLLRCTWCCIACGLGNSWGYNFAMVFLERDGVCPSIHLI